MEKTSWGNVADWYHDHLSEGDTYHSRLILPNLIRMAGLSKAGAKAMPAVLDLACGEGVGSRAMHEAGARVVGVDISPELIAIAKKNSPKEISFFVSPAHTLPFIKARSIDVVSVILAIQNIAEVKETFAEISRVLVPGGRLIIVMNHPAFRIPKASSWGNDEGHQYRRIDAYMSERKEAMLMHPGKSHDVTVSFHRPLQYYFKLLSNAGFAVGRLEEWISDKKSQPGPHSKEEDRMRREIPLFLAVEAIYTSLAA